MKSDILLCFPPLQDYGRKRSLSFSFLHLMNMMPLGVTYLAASCKEAGFKPAILDMEVNKLPITEIIKYFRLLNPKIVAFSATSAAFPMVRKLARIIKEKIDMTVPIIVGGPHATIDPRHAILDPNIDFLVRREGEITLVELIKALLDKHTPQFDKIQGISFKIPKHSLSEGEFKKISGTLNTEDKNSGNRLKKPMNPLGNELRSVDPSFSKRFLISEVETQVKEHFYVHHNIDRPDIEDLDSLPFPLLKLLPYKKYFNPLAKENPCASMIATRGCPYRCVFCVQIYPKPRHRSPEHLVREIQHIHKELRIRDIAFVDSTLNMKTKWLKRVCEEIIQEKVDVLWRARLRPDNIDINLLKKAKKSGCYNISFGVESGNDRILKLLRKDFTTQDVERAFKLAAHVGIETHAYFIIGSPTETIPEIAKTLRFIMKIKPDFIMENICVPQFGSELRKIAAERGWLLEDASLTDLEGAVSELWDGGGLDHDTIYRLYKQISRKFLLSKQNILNLGRKFLKHPGRMVRNTVLIGKYLFGR